MHIRTARRGPRVGEQDVDGRPAGGGDGVPVHPVHLVGRAQVRLHPGDLHGRVELPDLARDALRLGGVGVVVQHQRLDRVPLARLGEAQRCCFSDSAACACDEDVEGVHFWCCSWGGFCGFVWRVLWCGGGWEFRDIRVVISIQEVDD